MKNYLMRDYNRNGGDYFDDAFTNFFRPVFYDDRFDNMKTDIKESDNGYTFEVELPGFDKQDLSLNLENGYLTIGANKVVKEEGDKKSKFLRRERSCQCRRSFYVGDDVTEEDIKAKYNNGVLEVNVPKDQPKQIPEKKKIEIE